MAIMDLPRRPSWEQSLPLRLRFEREAYTVYPSLQCTTIGHRKYARVAYRVLVPIEGYEPRTVEMHFRRTSPEPLHMHTFADGPTESPHRYGPPRKDRNRRPSLCIWYPDDPAERRWIPRDGLLTLIEMARVHLFKEAWYRETGEWLGDEVPHLHEPRSEMC
jgi:hypothetical protein